MPLLFVLDNELGIGYAGDTSGDISPLINELMVPPSNKQSNNSQSLIQKILLHKLQAKLFFSKRLSPKFNPDSIG